MPAPASVYGHRGASIARPENTLAAFDLAFDQGAVGIELDVALSSDGIPVVMHDSHVDRTTDGVGAVDALTLQELRALDAGDGHPVPTLDEVLALAAARGAEVNIEIKAADAAAAVLEVVGGHEGLAWFISSFHWDTLRQVRALAPDARIYPLTLGDTGIEALRAMAIEQGYPRETMEAETGRFSHLAGTLADAIAVAAELGAEGLSVWERGLTAADITRMHEAGLRVWVWTINDPERAVEVLRDGADAVCTDDPAAIIAACAAL